MENKSELEVIEFQLQPEIGQTVKVYTGGKTAAYGVIIGFFTRYMPNKNMNRRCVELVEIAPIPTQYCDYCLNMNRVKFLS